MSEERFENVTIVKRANVYFDGKVTSRTVEFPDGTRKTLGVMLAGEYQFDTGVEELMEVLGGEMTVKLPGSDEWRTFTTARADSSHPHLGRRGEARDLGADAAETDHEHGLAAQPL